MREAVREVLLKVVYARMGGPGGKPSSVPLFAHPYYWAGWALVGAGGAVFGVSEAMESKTRTHARHGHRHAGNLSLAVHPEKWGVHVNAGARLRPV